jgi:hypothetical protein
MTFRRLLPLLSLVAACSTTAPPAGPDLEARILATHNAARAEVGVPPLRWDASLAADARRWAEHLAQADRLLHEGAPGGPGENLWIGTRGAYRVEQMIGTWAAEKPAFRRKRRWEDDFPRLGHYTQMIWRGSTAVGCGMAGNDRHDILVCRYWPPGNRVGEQPY